MFFQHLQLTSEMKSTVMTSNFMEKHLNQTKQDVTISEKKSSSNLRTTLAALKQNANSSWDAAKRSC